MGVRTLSVGGSFEDRGGIAIHFQSSSIIGIVTRSNMLAYLMTR